MGYRGLSSFKHFKARWICVKSLFCCTCDSFRNFIKYLVDDVYGKNLQTHPNQLFMTLTMDEK